MDILKKNVQTTSKVAIAF